ncbi:uncharacterized protein LOC107874154 [Capsicum annuum]|uniref:uncharacterized protein LOC107874154 n=1 Tax=Capsicum annuum TaxID=4072 RepID=UPI001FB1545D|nr:uncharacterized protein LOC107874154 [Capsicum annuum]
MRLEASINVARLLLYYGLPFRGHDESESSSNQGYFLIFLRWHRDNHLDVGKVILEKAPQNDTLTCPMIQNDIVNACAKQTLKVIIADLNGDYFAIAKTHVEVEDFFYHVTNVLNVVEGSFKRRDLLRHHQAKNSKQLLESGEAHTGQGLHQERGLQRPGDTRWGSHFKTLDNFLVIFSSIVHVLGVIEIEGSTSSNRNQAEYLLTKFLNISKKRLQDMRENGWKSLVNDVSSFCDSHDILIPKLDESYFPEKSKRKCLDVFYSHHLRVEIFCAVIDVQPQELNERFDVVSSDLLLGMGSLNPVNSFSNFDKGRIMTLAKCYPNEFDDGKLRDLSYQLNTFIIHMRGGNSKFYNLQEIRDLTKTLVEKNLVETYSLVYLLVKLTLILPVAMATVEKVFSSMKHIKMKCEIVLVINI